MISSSPRAASEPASFVANSQRKYSQSGGKTASLASLLQIAAAAAVLAGSIEGLGLLLFQRINWAEWARVMHVSKPILWISPAVDLVFFLLLGLVVWAFAKLSPRLDAVRILVFVLVFLTAYDWLMLTGHFYRRAALIFGLGASMAFDRWFRKRQPALTHAFKRSAPAALGFLAVVFLGIQGGTWLNERRQISQLPQAPPNSPNVLVIVVDTLRADHLSSYGYSRPTSPTIDRLARQGVLFENAIAPSSWSLPSHASLVTGRPVHHHGFGNVQPMPWLGWGKQGLNGLPTLGEAFKKEGYRTGAFSANRIYFTSNVGLGRGFIHFADYFHTIGDAFVRTQFGREFARLFMNRSEKSWFTRTFRHLGLGAWLDKDSEGSGDYGGIFGIRKRAREVNRETLAWVARDRGRPFFAFLNYLDVHFGYGGPPGYPKPAWDRGSTIDEYDAGVKYADDSIGQLLDGLNRLGALANTIVVITSDHGEALGDHGLSFHGAALYWELVHVPLVISCPGRIPAGIRVPQPVSNAQLAKTVIDLAGADENPFPGGSLASAWKANEKEPENWPPVISELPQTNTIAPADRAMGGEIPIAIDGWMLSVITPEWQWIIHEKRGSRLYRWRLDPAEMKDLGTTPEGRAAIRNLQRELPNLYRKVPVSGSSDPSRTIVRSSEIP